LYDACIQICILTTLMIFKQMYLTEVSMLIITVCFRSCVSIMFVQGNCRCAFSLDILFLKLQLHAILELLCAFTLGNKKWWWCFSVLLEKYYSLYNACANYFV